MIWSMAGVLYEPAFAVITAACGKNAPRGIITLTLVGGFASTVCMPVTQYLVSALGWRHALWVLAGANLAICLPLHAWFVPRPAAPGVSPAAGKVAAASVYAAMARERAFWGLALWFTAYNAIGSALVFQFIPLMREWRLGTAAILSCMMRPHAGGGPAGVDALPGQAGRADHGRGGAGLVPGHPAGHAPAAAPGGLARGSTAPWPSR